MNSSAIKQKDWKQRSGTMKKRKGERLNDKSIEFAEEIDECLPHYLDSFCFRALYKIFPLDLWTLFGRL